MTVAADAPLTCDEIRGLLGRINRLIYDLSQPGVRSVRDSDGSEVQYSMASMAALSDQRMRLQALYDACCGGRGGGPFGFIFP
jgi:hypothetical protein